MQERIVAFVTDRVRQAVEKQDWDTAEVAKVSTLCGRLVRANPEHLSFVAEMKAISDKQTRERPGHGFMATVPWISLSSEFEQLGG